MFPVTLLTGQFNQKISNTRHFGYIVKIAKQFEPEPKCPGPKSYQRVRPRSDMSDTLLTHTIMVHKLIYSDIGPRQ